MPWTEPADALPVGRAADVLALERDGGGLPIGRARHGMGADRRAAARIDSHARA
jgi:hypothetical protein